MLPWLQLMLLRMNNLIFLQTVVKKNLPAFRDYQIDENRSDQFFVRYFESCSRFATLIVIVKLVMVLSHGQSAVEHGFSTNKSLLIENLSEKSLINQRIVVDYMKSSDYKPLRNKLINANGLMSHEQMSLLRVFEVLSVNILKISSTERRNCFRRKTRKNQLKRILWLWTKHCIGEREWSISLWSWEKTKFELLSKSNALKRAVNEKQAEFDQCLKEKKRLLEEMKTHQ